jgi:hypothetical protein
MAKKTKKTQEPIVDVDESGEVVETAAPSASAVLELFKEYDDACSDLADLESRIGTAKRFKSDAVQAIVNAAGKGPFDYGGKVLIPMVKDGTWFFRGERQTQAIKIG